MIDCNMENWFKQFQIRLTSDNNFSNSSASLNSNNFQSETTYLSTYKNLDDKEFGKHKRKSRRRIDQRTAPKCVNNTIDKRNKIKLIKKIRNSSSAKEPPLKDENDPPIKKYLNLFHIKCGLLGNTLDRYCWKIEEHLRNIMGLNCSTLRLKSLNTIERLLPVYHYRLYQNNFKDIFQVNKYSKYIPKSKIKSKSCNELIFFTPIKNSNNFLKLHNTSLERIQTKYNSDLSNNIRRVHIRSCIKIVTKWLKNNKSKHDLEIPKGNNKNNIIHIKHPSKDFEQHTEVPVKITEDPNKIIIRLLTGNLMNESNTSIKNKISSKTSLHSKKEIPNPLKLTRNAQQTTLNSQDIILNTEKIFFNNRIAIFEPKILTLNPSILHSTKSDQTKSPVATIKSKQSNKRDIEKSTLNLTKVTEKSMKKTNSPKATSSVQNISNHTKKVQRRKKKQGKPPSESIIIADKIISKPKKTAKYTVTPPAKKTLQQVTIDLPCNKTPIKSPTTPPKTPSKVPKKLPEGLKGFKNSSSGNKSCSNNDCDDCIIEPWKKHDVDDVEDSVNNTPWSRREAGLPTRPSGCFDPSKGDECKKNKNCKFVAVEEKGEFIWHKIIGNEAPTWIYPNEVKVNNNFNIRKNPFIVTERSNLNFKGLEIILPTYLNGGSRGTCSKSGVKDTCVETNQCGLTSSRDTWAPVEIKKNFDQTGIPQEKKTDDTSKNKCSKFISIIKDTVSALMTIFAIQKPREEVTSKIEKFLPNLHSQEKKEIFVNYTQNNPEHVITSARGVIRIIQLNNNSSEKEISRNKDKIATKSKSKYFKNKETFITPKVCKSKLKNETFFNASPVVKDMLHNIFKKIDAEKANKITKLFYEDKSNMSKLLVNNMNNKTLSERSTPEKLCLSSSKSKTIETSQIPTVKKNKNVDSSLSVLNNRKNIVRVIEEAKPNQKLEDCAQDFTTKNISQQRVLNENKLKDLKEESTLLFNPLKINKAESSSKDQTENAKQQLNETKNILKTNETNENHDSKYNFVEILVNQSKSDLKSINKKTIELKLKQLARINQQNAKRPSLSALDLFRKRDESYFVVKTYAKSYSPLGTFQPRIIVKKRKSRKFRPGDKITFKDILAKQEEQQRKLEYKRQYALRRSKSKGVSKIGNVQIVVNKHKSNKNYKK